LEQLENFFEQMNAVTEETVLTSYSSASHYWMNCLTEMSLNWTKFLFLDATTPSKRFARKSLRYKFMLN